MRRFLSILALCLILPRIALAENERPMLEAIKAFRGPMEQIVGEAAKGSAANLTAIGKSYAEAQAAWLKVTAERLELDEYGVPANQQEEVWRQVRTLGLLMGYLEEAVQRGDRTLILHAADMLTPAYDRVATALEAGGK